jgi:hypothetical protein
MLEEKGQNQYTVLHTGPLQTRKQFNTTMRCMDQKNKALYRELLDLKNSVSKTDTVYHPDEYDEDDSPEHSGDITDSVLSKNDTKHNSEDYDDNSELYLTLDETKSKLDKQKIGDIGHNYRVSLPCPDLQSEIIVLESPQHVAVFVGKPNENTKKCMYHHDFTNDTLKFNKIRSHVISSNAITDRSYGSDFTRNMKGDRETATALCSKYIEYYCETSGNKKGAITNTHLFRAKNLDLFIVKNSSHELTAMAIPVSEYYPEPEKKAPADKRSTVPTNAARLYPTILEAPIEKQSRAQKTVQCKSVPRDYFISDEYCNYGNYIMQIE